MIEYTCKERNNNFIMCKNKATIFLHYKLTNIYFCICKCCYNRNMDLLSNSTFFKNSVKITKEEYHRIQQTKILK